MNEQKKNVVRGIVFLLCVLVTIASVMNVVLDNAEVIAKAQEVACEGKPKCDMAKAEMMRLPVWQTISFTNGKRTVNVRCTRSAIAFGDYACKVVP